MTKCTHIAIDGPVAAGKGTVASILAQKLDILYIDTGAMYRAVALLAKQKGVDWNNESAIMALLKLHSIGVAKYQDGSHGCDVSIDNKSVSGKIRTSEISKGSSVVAKHAKVRAHLVSIQQKVAQNRSVVMEGRDITSVVLPHADYKIYLTAEPEVRAKRRYKENLDKGSTATYNQVLEQTKERDKRDIERSSSPLTIVDDAIVVDTTDMTIDQVVTHIKKLITKQ